MLLCRPGHIRFHFVHVNSHTCWMTNYLTSFLCNLITNQYHSSVNLLHGEDYVFPVTCSLILIMLSTHWHYCFAKAQSETKTWTLSVLPFVHSFVSDISCLQDSIKPNEKQVIDTQSMNERQLLQHSILYPADYIFGESVATRPQSPCFCPLWQRSNSIDVGRVQVH